MQIKILMIDDHPSQIEGYKIILSYNLSSVNIETTAAFSFEKAYQIITNKINPIKFDVIFLDWSMPSYEDERIKSGEDLAYVIRKYLPDAKIVMITSHCESFLIYNIIKQINPSGMLIKSDFTGNELLIAFDTIINGGIYYSDTVKLSLKHLLSGENYIDSYNRQIIILLSQGIKTKNIPKYLNISQSAVEKRKMQIKDYLCIQKGTDEDIIKESKKKGFI